MVNINARYIEPPALRADHYRREKKQDRTADQRPRASRPTFVSDRNESEKVRNQPYGTRDEKQYDAKTDGNQKSGVPDHSPDCDQYQTHSRPPQRQILMRLCGLLNAAVLQCTGERRQAEDQETCPT
ncbi:hypothetical protein [Paraburkholderia sediminicola]|uniref:hypothetical protein n=1 Tax=Paraburkholderia sediminicola TaxID=458836 RepID=UPI0038B80C3E